MLQYVIRRLLYSIVVLVAASILVFTFVAKSGDPLAALRLNPRISQQSIQNIKDKKHLDDPIWVRYGYWARDAATNGFGESLHEGVRCTCASQASGLGLDGAVRPSVSIKAEPIESRREVLEPHRRADVATAGDRVGSCPTAEATAPEPPARAGLPNQAPRRPERRVRGPRA